MKTLVLNLPSTIEVDGDEIKNLIAPKFYEKGKMSLGQAAEFAGFLKRAFAEILGSYGVSIFNYPASDLESDVENVNSRRF